MVIDHIAKPLIAARRMEPWATDVRAAAANPNVWCKLSGMITEADHAAWSPDDLAPYVEVALDAFGVGRLMYGSDWPVCTLAGSYGQVIGALRTVLGSIDAGVEARLFGGSAAEFYGIEIEEEGSS
jgi:L-fuconolactonase